MGDEITPKPLSDIERVMFAPRGRSVKLDAGSKLPPVEPPPEGATDAEIVDRMLALVAEGYGVPEICRVDGYPSAGEFLAATKRDPALGKRFRDAKHTRAFVLQESRLIRARDSDSASAFELVARDIHIVDAPETNPAHKVEHAGVNGAPLSINVKFVKPND